jgi:hypothetical protein
MLSYSSSNVPRTTYPTASSKRSSSRNPHSRESIPYSTHDSRREPHRDSKHAHTSIGSSINDRHSRSYHDQGGYGIAEASGSSQGYDYASPMDMGYQSQPVGSQAPQGYSMSGLPLSPTVIPVGASMAAQMGSMSLNEPSTAAKYTVSAAYGATSGNPSYSTPNTYPSTSSYSYDKTSNNTSIASPQYGTNYGGQGGGDMNAHPQTDHRASQSPSHRYVAGTSGDREKLDSRYQVRNHDYKKFFKPGRVFSTLWTVPASGKTNNNETFISYVKYGERVHTKIRRFVVVTQKSKHCTCLPVTSYEGRGYKKPDIDLNEHGPIYSSKRPRSVPEITKKALKVVLSKNAEPLRDPSLINYGCMYTVETNVKVMDVGVLDADSLYLLEDYYLEVNYPRTTDVNPSKDESDLAGVGAGFASGEQSYGSTTRAGYTSPTMHDRSSSFRSDENSAQSGSDTYRIHAAGATGYTSSSVYTKQASTIPSTGGYAPPIVSSSRYSTSPTSPLEGRHSNIMGASVSSHAYSGAEILSSTARFSPRSDASGNPENYTTQPPYPSASSQSSKYRPGDTYGEDGLDNDPTNTPRLGEMYTSTSSSSRVNEVAYSSNRPSDYSSSTPRRGDTYTSSTSHARADEAPYSSSSRPSGGESDYTYRTAPSGALPHPSRDEPVFHEDDDPDLDEGGDIILPTREEVAASRPPRSRHRDSVSRSSHTYARERPREDVRETASSSSSRHHGRSDRDRDRDRKSRR